MAKDVAKTGKEVVQVDEDFDREIQGDAGKGIGTTEGGFLPLIYVLQPLSPQVEQDGPRSIENARPGDIWLRNALDPIIKGKEGLWFMPCASYLRWVEWRPRDQGGGFIASYDHNGRNHLPEGAVRDSKNQLRFYFPDSGNQCTETRYIAGFVWRDGTPMAYMSPFSSTGHRVSNDWIRTQQALRRKDGTSWPSWSHIYKLTTTSAENNLGRWFQLVIGRPEIYIPGYGRGYEIALEIVGGDYRSAYALGKKLQEGVEKGLHREAAPDDLDDSAATINGGGASDTVPMQDEIPF